jgi:GH25 family lysozyme M1 (1,4-beta-N-acetylmuramidase)
MNVRREPQLMPDNVITQLQPGEVKVIEHWKAGSPVEGNNVWFKISGSGYVHSSGFTNTSTSNIPEVKDPVVVPPVTPTPPQYADLTSKVIDISSHNEVVDFALAKSSVRGVVAKAGHTGVSYGGIQPQNEDPTFKKYKREFGEKLVGAYWYGYPSLDPVTEANAFLTSVGEVPETFTYWLDIEEADGINDQAKVNEWCNTFLTTIEKAIKRKAGIYCNRNWYEKILTDVTKKERPIWLAHYGTAEMSNPVTRQVAHQYTSDGRVPGFATDDRVDLNAVTEGFFIKLAPPTTDPTEPTPDPEDPVIVQPTPDPAEPDVVTRIKTVAINATVTFVQAFLATWAATGFQLDKVVLAGAVGGALSLVWNTILKPFAIAQGWLKA